MASGIRRVGWVTERTLGLCAILHKPFGPSWAIEYQVMTTPLAVAASLIALAFTGALVERWLVSRRPQSFAWSISLALFFLGAGALAWGSATGWTSISFRLFFGFGAIVNVPFLACGQLYLFLRRQLADRIFIAVSLASAFALGVVLVAPFRAPLTSDELPKGSDVFGPLPRVLAAVGSGVSATVVFVGTALGVAGALRQRRRAADTVLRTKLTRRAVGLALLTLGTVVLSLSGTLNSVLGEMQAFAVTLTIGIAILFAGFLITET